MPVLDLKYGRSSIPFEFDNDRFEVLGSGPEARPLTDPEIGERFESPIGSKPIEELVSAGETVLIVVPDATRRTASGQIVNLLVRRLIANGTAPFEIGVIFATGIHRKATDEEKKEIVTPFIFQRIRTFDHHAKDLMKIAGLESTQFADLGMTSGGIRIELNRLLTEYDHVITVGGVSFHYFAGFTGGRKLICPGLASAETISETHRLAFDFERRARRDGVGPGLLDGNVVHEAFMDAAARIAPRFSVNSIVGESGEATHVFCGDWIESHRSACESYARSHTVRISAKRELVIASCGGWPHDINMIQAHKALDAASRACLDGGTIILLAECEDGLGKSDFLDWFKAGDSAALAGLLCENYQVNGQTAWSLLKKAERFDVKIVTALPEEATHQMGLNKIGGSDLSAHSAQNGYILPFGAKFLVETV